MLCSLKRSTIKVENMEPDLIQNSVTIETYDDYDFGPKLKRLKVTDNVRELQTVLRDRNTNRSDFIFYADRLIRLVVEEGLNQLPYKNCEVITPTGQPYKGLQYEKGNCGVSIMRSASILKSQPTDLKILTKLKYNTWSSLKTGISGTEKQMDSRETTVCVSVPSLLWSAMEQGLRDCCRSIRIGKILAYSDEDTHDAKVVYAKLPQDVDQRKVLLMYPIISSGNTVMKAVNILKDHKVLEENIILLNLFATPTAVKALIKLFPEMTILTSEIHPVAPNHFGQKYFGN